MNVDSSTAVRIGVLDVLPLRERELVEHVDTAWRRGTGGWIVTANVDILRTAGRDAGAAALIGNADLVVADGMPLVWASRLAGTPVPERVTGASLVFSLSGAAARAGRSVYLLGGKPGVPEAAATALAEQHPGLRIAGTDSPPLGFQHTAATLEPVLRKVRDAEPDLVLVALGFPKQEHTIRRLRQLWPPAWYVGCGAGIPMAAGEFRRAPEVMQRMGAEWLHRLAQEPRRLARRYLVHDAPFALQLLAGAACTRVRRWGRG
ncbi:WecB/TagA/CpsF family glycosyltransferase [Amycolatopsis suaedae]|uniref:Glycosyltransferase n=1 Tax=Amycolatopsis suaedae TaxID=2510978 RepID=A0A4Q7JB59_9PSEU|nr:WecB/TagA/CpsF family glycosyltransferase [Amycolatopsis suaedae]RZQ64236.1 glycosyltransferase [Amycolatopsis suaedae]